MSRSPQPKQPQTPRGRLEPSTLDLLFRHVGSLPVLTRAEERELTRRFRDLRRAEHALVAGMPFTAQRLADRIRSRDLRRVWSRTDAPDDARLEAIAGSLSRRLAHMPSCTARDADTSAAWDRFEARMRDYVLSLGLHPDFLDDATNATVGIAGQGGKRNGRRDASSPKALGYPLRRLRPRLRELARAREAREACRNEIARRNVKLVVRVAKDFRGLGVAFPDLIQEGTLGLLRGIELFDPDRGFKLSTYSVWWIRQSIIRAVQTQARTVRLPGHVNERIHTFGRIEEDLTRRNGRQPDETELAEHAGLDLEAVHALCSVRQGTASFDAELSEDGDRNLHGILADQSSPTPADHLEMRSDQELTAELLSRLEPLERRLIALRFGFETPDGRPAPARDLANELGVSRNTIAKREAEVLAKLRRAASNRERESTNEETNRT